MALLSRFWLRIQDRELATSYRLTFTRKIIVIGMALLAMRLTVYIVSLILTMNAAPGKYTK